MKYRQSIFLLLAAFTACQRDAGPAVAADSVASDEAKSSGIRAFGRVGNAAPPRLDISAPEEAQARGEVQATSAVAPGVDPFQSFTIAGAQPMIIRTGQAFIEVEKVDPAILKIRQLSARVGGYIANSSVSGGRDQIRQATLELKIPSTQYEQALGDLSSIGKVETVS
ncbi:MAG TPA: DUF4349 domain-containing protein, partial [Gemmatimonadaceae bacterium]|nr:DUF4349 domain-containing protein [Gemmatimonadaceae bacterium]